MADLGDVGARAVCCALLYRGCLPDLRYRVRCLSRAECHRLCRDLWIPGSFCWSAVRLLACFVRAEWGSSDWANAAVRAALMTFRVVADDHAARHLRAGPGRLSLRLTSAESLALNPISVDGVAYTSCLVVTSVRVRRSCEPPKGRTGYSSDLDRDGIACET